ncbi:ROK family transcriptional regulator [soil metagenome]
MDDDASVAPGPAPGSTTALRTANQRRVIEVLQRHDLDRPLTQADIARATLLAPATVSNIVRDLAAAGLVDTTAGSGRRGSAVRMSPQAGYIVGIDVGHSHLRVAVGDLGGRAIAEARSRLDPTHGHGDAIDLVLDLLEPLLAQLGAGLGDVLSAGIGLPTPIEADGRVPDSSILPGWVGVQPAAAVGERLGVVAHADNDANLGALAEYRRGAGRGHACMAYVKVASGVGCGIIIDGRPFRGGSGIAGELGHLCVDEEGPLCRCGGRGCLEAYCSASVVTSLLAAQLPGATLTEVIDAARAGNAGAVRAIEDAGTRLGWGLAIVANLLNPTCMVLGGELALAGELLLGPVRTSLRRHSLASVAGSLTLRTSTLEDRSSLVGALLLAMESAALSLPAAP